MAARCQTSSANTSSAQAAQATSAQRHEPVAWTIANWNTGAAAQPRLPLMPCTENAWPRRGGETRLLRIVKSTGWNGELPRPASAAASSSPSMPCAIEASSPAADKTGQGREQHRPRADAIDEETGQRLADARDDEKHRHHQAELRRS